MNALSATAITAIALASLLLVQVAWALSRPPLLSKPSTWLIHWSLKTNAGLAPAMAALSYL